MRSDRVFRLFLLLPLALGGCDYAKNMVQNIHPPFVTREGRRLDTGEAVMGKGSYPAQRPFGAPLDIEVIRTGNGIQFENRSTREYHHVDIWLNQEYGASLEGVDIGRGELIALRSFKNRFGEHYPVAKFLEPDADRPLVSVEISYEGDEKLHPLTVRLTDSWRRP